MDTKRWIAEQVFSANDLRANYMGIVGAWSEDFLAHDFMVSH